MGASVDTIHIPDGPCIETRVRTNSIRLGSRYINLQRLADEVECTEGYLSKALRDPDRNVSVKLLKKLASALDITTDQLIALMEDRKKVGNRRW